tara:strand:+ start:62 stop:445 length:384 start_codon:yes stop_codon:yes gene_type:complete
MTLKWTKFIKGDNVPLYQPETMPSKDQQSIDEPTSYEKWDRARTLMLESLHKPDNALRSCAHNQQCYYELMDIKDQVIEIVRRMKNPIPLVEPTLEPPVNEDGSKSYEYAAHVTLTDIAKFQRGSSL